MPDSPGLGGSRLLPQALHARWLRLSTGSVNRRVFGAALIVGTMTMAIKVISLFKESLVAASFGTGSAFDAFIVAMLLPTTLAAILAGSLNAALIPTYIEVRERDGAEAAQRLYATILMWNTVLLVLMSVVMLATARFWLPLLGSGFDPAKLALAHRLLYWSMPIIFLTGFATTWAGLLNAGEKFALVAIAPAMEPLAIILVLVLCFRSLGIYALMGGTVLGMALETVIIGVALHRRGHSLLPKWHGATEAFRKVRGQYGACIAGAFIVSGQPLVDQAFASTLGPRSNSALAYGSKLVGLILSLGAAALGTAILPQLSKMVAGNNWEAIRKFLRFYAGLILGVTVPLTVLLIGISGFLVRTMYQHGSFTAADTSLVTRIQILYLLRIPFSTCGVLVTRTLTALRANQILLWFSFVSFTINALLDWLFIQRLGIAGITLSTSVCSCTVFLGLSWAMVRRLRQRAAGMEG